MVEVGDRMLVESEKVGMVTRSGVVMAVDGRLITVRWDSGGCPDRRGTLVAARRVIRRHPPWLV
jgi:hypothetical protein